MLGVLVQEEQKTGQEHMLMALYHAQAAIMKQEFVVAQTQLSVYHVHSALGAVVLVLVTLVQMFSVTMFLRLDAINSGWATPIQPPKS